MSKTFWYIVTVKGKTFTAIWKSSWVKVSRDAYFWSDRKVAKETAKSLRKRYPNLSIRVVERKELEPWFVGEALEDKPDVPAFTKFVLPLVRKTFPPLLMKKLCTVQPMVLR